MLVMLYVRLIQGSSQQQSAVGGPECRMVLSSVQHNLAQPRDPSAAPTGTLHVQATSKGRQNKARANRTGSHWLRRRCGCMYAACYTAH